ncbi:Uncharacterised protein [Bergeriella denitrificans]|uniref:Uncharacterized protein n=1 Tax=Bergeriella denitrificans TaxID=494 RepID=A0A378UE34_BERDE|nr:Uncharacterised protein [Bergeriella denitrificans]
MLAFLIGCVVVAYVVYALSCIIGSIIGFFYSLYIIITDK